MAQNDSEGSQRAHDHTLDDQAHPHAHEDHEHDHSHDDHAHAHEDHGHDHPHDDHAQADAHSHDHGDDHSHGEGDHEHATGIKGFLSGLFHTHSHEGPHTDTALEGSERGIWALKVSLIGLFATAIFQVVIVYFSGSVSLLADTIHNFADALTALPLWLAFVVGRRAANRRYTYGYARAEDLAGVAIVVIIFASALLAAYESYQRFIDPQPLRNLPWVVVAAIVGFIGNEVVARFRISVGREINSAALVADGEHARVDGLTSLAVLVGAIGSWLGYAIIDPIIGALITIAILFVVRDAARSIWERLLDAVDPSLVAAIEEAARPVQGVEATDAVRVRWLGHKLLAELHITVDRDLSTATSHDIAEQVRHALLHRLPQLSTVTVHVDPCNHDGSDSHAITRHHFAT